MHEDIENFLKLQMPYSWDALSCILKLDPISQFMQFRQTIESIVNNHTYALAIIREFVDSKSLFLDFNNSDAAKSLMEKIIDSKFSEVSFNGYSKPELNELVSFMKTPGSVSNWLNFIVPYKPNVSSEYGRLLGLCDYDAVISHTISPQKRLADVLKNEKMRFGEVRNKAKIKGGISWR